MSVLPSRLVSTIIGISFVPGSFFNSPSTSKPFFFGKIRSNRMRSGVSFFAILSPSSPLSAFNICIFFCSNIEPIARCRDSSSSINKIFFIFFYLINKFIMFARLDSARLASSFLNWKGKPKCRPFFLFGGKSDSSPLFFYFSLFCRIPYSVIRQMLDHPFYPFFIGQDHRQVVLCKNAYLHIIGRRKFFVIFHDPLCKCAQRKGRRPQNKIAVLDAIYLQQVIYRPYHSFILSVDCLQIRARAVVQFVFLLRIL